MKGTWRDHCRPIIARVLADHKGQPTLKKALRDAYPYGERAYHPYKIWLDEIRVQMGFKKLLNKKGLRRHAAQVISTDQLSLFSEEK